MSILLVARHRDMEPFKKALLDLDSNLDVEIWPGVRSAERVTFAVAWAQPENIFSNYPNLKVVSSLGAGADHLIDDSSIANHVSLTRIVAPSFASQMSDYVTTAVYDILRKTHIYYQHQLNGDWKTELAYKKGDLRVGIMGLGELGNKAATQLIKNGFSVNGWTRTKKKIKGIEPFGQSELEEFLAASNILVCLLPLTAETEEILNLEVFKKLREPSFVINAGRGEHLVDEDLIYALDADIIKSATLDVFRNEPLPNSHPFWNRKNIIITPHVASVTHPEEVAIMILENYKRMLSGMELLHLVDKKKGY